MISVISVLSFLKCKKHERSQSIPAGTGRDNKEKKEGCPFNNKKRVWTAQFVFLFRVYVDHDGLYCRG